MKKIIGSESFKISSVELISIGKGIIIAVVGALLTEITRQLTGADFSIHWNAFHVGPLEFQTGVYNATLVIWVAWSAFVNFLRKWVPDTQESK